MNSDKLVRLSAITYESLVNGPGIRRVFFSQGCKHGCKNCFNPVTHSFSGGELKNMDGLIGDIKKNPILSGITFSGGDPFEQADKFAYMAKATKNMGLNIWCYTGYTFEYILTNKNNRVGWNELLNYIDVLVDGRFEEEKKIPGLRFKGSANQRIINVQESLRVGNVIFQKEYEIGECV